MPLQSENQLACERNMARPSSVKPGDGGELFLQNNCSLSTDYTTQHYIPENRTLQKLPKKVLIMTQR
jgi:hypothetical protein